MKSREQLFKAKNKRQTKFEIFTNRMSSQFKLIKMKMIKDMIDFVIQRIVQRANLAFEQERQNWNKSRDNRDRDQDRNRNENNQTKENDNQMIDEKKRNKNDIW